MLFCGGGQGVGSHIPQASLELILRFQLLGPRCAPLYSAPCLSFGFLVLFVDAAFLVLGMESGPPALESGDFPVSYTASSVTALRGMLPGALI